MASFICVVDFLPAQTELMVGITLTPETKLTKEQTDCIVRDLKNFPYKNDFFAIRAILQEPLKLNSIFLIKVIYKKKLNLVNALSGR